jgi:Class III cytochrome C family
MQKKIQGIALIVAAAILAIIINVTRDLYSREGRETPDRRQMNILVIAHPEIFGHLERPQVVFNHGLHENKYIKEGCRICHPQNEEGNFIFDFPFRPVLRDKESIMDSYHGICIGCHTRLVKEHKKAGPVQCGSCHRNEFQSVKIQYPLCDFDFGKHDKHTKKLKENCSYCHHIYDTEEKDEELRLVYEKGTEESCFYCHDIEKKRGPALSRITRVAAEKGLSMRKVSHAQCVNCHLTYVRKGEKTGPRVCSECHSGKYLTIADLAKVPRPDRDQPKKPFILINDAQMKGVPFDHAIHEKNSRTCRSCHHETLQACKKCHGIVGGQESRGINITGAYHDVFSGSACTGCHEVKKTERDCSGCHHHLLDMGVQAKGPKKAFCAVCHSGRKEGLSVTPIAVRDLSDRKVPERVTIKVLENEYEPATFPHREIVQKLVNISNRSKMATDFHRGIESICRGCHHESDPQAEAKVDTPPNCRKCHAIRFDSLNMNKPRLLAAYHRQCMGCHDMMGITKTEACKDCHKEKSVPRQALLKN